MCYLFYFPILFYICLLGISFSFLTMADQSTHSDLSSACIDCRHLDIRIGKRLVVQEGLLFLFLLFFVVHLICIGVSWMLVYTF